MVARYAGKGFAFDCLSVKMKTPYIDNYGFLNVKGGTVVCDSPNIRPGIALSAVLVAEHLTLLLLPLVMIAIFGLRLKMNKLKVQAADIVYISMGVFSLASLAEITQHIHDNWLYLGLIPSYNNAVFYGGLTTGQALLAWGIGGNGPHVLVSAAASAASILALIVATVLSANDPNPTIAGLPVVTLLFAVVFISLTITTGDYLNNSWQQFKGFALNLMLTGAVVISYAAGVVFSILVQTTGQQLFHVPTAAGFVLGFVFQITWILLASNSQSSSKRD